MAPARRIQCELPKAIEARRANGENVEFPDRPDQQGHRVKPAKKVSTDHAAIEAELVSADQWESWALRDGLRISEG
jgi:hypothetical protein